MAMHSSSSVGAGPYDPGSADDDKCDTNVSATVTTTTPNTAEVVSTSLAPAVFSTDTELWNTSLFPNNDRSIQSDIVTLLYAHDKEMTNAILFAFLAPDLKSLNHEDCGLVRISRASKTHRQIALNSSLWKNISNQRWKSKAGYELRMEKAEKEEASHTADANNGFTVDVDFIQGSYWYRKFGTEERDALRAYITSNELQEMTFSFRVWFTVNHPPSIDEDEYVLRSGLTGKSISDHLNFQPDGQISGMPPKFNGSPYEMNETGTLVSIGRHISLGLYFDTSFYARRRPDWGWELQSNAYVARSIPSANECNKVDLESVWEDYTSKLAVQELKDRRRVVRHKKRYKYREIPDIQELKLFLEW